MNNFIKVLAILLILSSTIFSQENKETDKMTVKEVEDMKKKETGITETDEKPNESSNEISADEAEKAEESCKLFNDEKTVLATDYQGLTVQYIPAVGCHIWAIGRASLLKEKDLKSANGELINAFKEIGWKVKKSKDGKYYQTSFLEKTGRKLRVIILNYPEEKACPAFDEQATHEGTDWMSCYSKLKPEQQKLGISLSMAIDITPSTDTKAETKETQEVSTEIKSKETEEIKEKKEAN